ncbi:MAG: bacteriocin [Bacilli bacterium]|nr:bacteriocin [Bacilli bacterium]
MRELKDKELMNIEGGSNWLTASFFNAAARAMDTLMNVGRSLGSAIRRAFSGKVCSV